jgi:hypothetical protein
MDTNKFLAIFFGLGLLVACTKAPQTTECTSTVVEKIVKEEVPTTVYKENKRIVKDNENAEIIAGILKACKEGNLVVTDKYGTEFICVQKKNGA